MSKMFTTIIVTRMSGEGDLRERLNQGWTIHHSEGAGDFMIFVLEKRTAPKQPLPAPPGGCPGE